MNMLIALITIVLVYFVFSVACSALAEAYARYTQLRGSILKTQIEHVFNPLFTNKLYLHPLIVSYTPCIKKCHESEKPSYISPQFFASTLVNTIKKELNYENSSYREVIRKGQSEHETENVSWMLQAIIPPLATESHTTEATASVEKGDTRKMVCLKDKDINDNDNQAIIDGISNWFNDINKNVVKSTYKHKNYRVLLVVGLLVAIAFNIDTVNILRFFSSSDEASSAIAAMEGRSESSNSGGEKATDADNTDAEDIVSWMKIRLFSGIPLGWTWSCSPNCTGSERRKHAVCDLRAVPWTAGTEKGAIFNKIIGLLITALAISKGAEFWFDMLKLVTRAQNQNSIPEEDS